MTRGIGGYCFTHHRFHSAGCDECEHGPAKLGLNVGSGQRRFTSTHEVMWINIDKITRPGHEPDLICDGAHIPRADGSVDYFVLHHVLEHFGCNDGVDLLAEAHRVLKLGGSLLVFVPDLRILADRWLRHELSTQIYMTNLYGAWMGDEADRHKWGYDRDSLREFLQQVPWRTVGMFDWRMIPGADIARDWWIAGMECVR